MVKAALLTDEDILNYTGGSGKGARILTESRDFNLKKASFAVPYPGSVYDPAIFGSYYPNKCICGTTRVLHKRCIRAYCNSMVVTEVEMYSTYARIELPYYYLNSLRYAGFKKFFNSIFPPDAKHINLVYTGGKLDQTAFDLCQFEYDDERFMLTVTDTITDLNKVSYEGILRILEDHFPGKVDEYKNYVNRLVWVAPPVMRMFRYAYVNNVKKMEFPLLTGLYQAIINLSYYIEKVSNGYVDKTEAATSRAILRKFVNVCTQNMSGILSTSKANFARGLYGKQVNNSGRAVIVANPVCKIDEVSLPLHLALEAFKDQFTIFQRSKYTLSANEANLKIAKFEDTTKAEFLEWIKDRVVLMNRNPSLHEYNIMAFRVLINNDYTIGLPIMVCKPFGGDFDGDTMSFYAVPEDLEEDTIRRMSPRNLLVYKKNLQPLFVPSHEVLHGLNLASRVTIVENPQVIDDMDENELLMIDDNELVEFRGHLTTKHRIELSKILEAEFDGILEVPKIIDTKNILDLMASLHTKENRVEIIQKLQAYALEVITLEGVTSLSLEDIYKELPAEHLDKIKEILKSNETTQQKILQIDKIYSLYLTAVQSSLPDKVKTAVSSSDKIKPASVLSLVTPQVYIGDNGEITLTETSISKGFNYEDYVSHAVENRKIQDIKISTVPSGGYLTRQCVQVAQNYQYVNKTDDTNYGILIPGEYAEGRTDMDGNEITTSSPGKMVRVRSVISTLIEDTVTPDMIRNKKLTYEEGMMVGISMSTSLTEGFPQAGLALKHGGRLYTPDLAFKLEAPADCFYTSDNKWIYLTENEGGNVHRYPLPHNFELSENRTNFVKGEVVGYSYRINNPSHGLESIVKLIKAKAVGKYKVHERNSIVITDSYSITEGEVNYSYLGETLIAKIGSMVYIVNREAVCKYPEGTYIKKGQRFTSGLVNMNKLFSVSKDMDYLYLIFRDQFVTLRGGVTEELIEFLFTLVIRTVGTNYEYLGISGKSLKSKSLFSTLANERAKSIIQSVADSTNAPLEMKNDVFTKTIVSPLLLLIANSKKDEAPEDKS